MHLRCAVVAEEEAEADSSTRPLGGACPPAAPVPAPAQAEEPLISRPGTGSPCRIILAIHSGFIGTISIRGVKGIYGFSSNAVEGNFGLNTHM